MNESNYWGEDATKSLQERMRINDRELHRICELQKATKYRIDNSNDEDEIKKIQKRY